MDGTHLFELVIAMFLAIIVLHYIAHRMGLPPSVALLVGGGTLAFLPGLPRSLSIRNWFLLSFYRHCFSTERGRSPSIA
jgi:Kef-type K+ transport system membrane component KefB